MQKVCYGCEVSKDLSEYHKDRSKKDGLRGQCKECEKVRNRRKYVKHQRKYECSKCLVEFKAQWPRKNCWECLPKIRPGFKLQDFIEACERNNSGTGILYLVKFSGNGEEFYKIGITSRSVKKRYRNEKNYNYKKIWQISGDPEEIYKLESKIIKKSKNFRYQPELWPKGSNESFKCEKNSELLSVPK